MILESILSLAVLLAENPGSVVDTAKQVQSTVQYHVSNQYNYPIYYTNQVLFLTYHDISHHESEYSISPERFESHLKALKDHHYNVIGMEHYLDWIQKDKALPPNAVVITFDDGYQSFYREAYPLLQKYQYPATNFVVVSWVEYSNGWGVLTWDQMREMKRNGMSFYSHTYDSHDFANTLPNGYGKPVLTSPVYLEHQGRLETQQEYEDRVFKDLTWAEERLDQELGEQPNLLAFPYGRYSQKAIEKGKEAGIEFFFLFLEEGIADKKDTLVKRVNAGMRGLSGDSLIKKMGKYHGK